MKIVIIEDEQLTADDLAETILKVAKDEAVDILVMGRHSRRGLGKLLIGSVTEKVLHHSNLPLFIIPN